MSTIIEQIKAEIERRRNNARNWSNKAKYKGPHYHKMRGIESACDAILSFLNTIEEQDKPTILNEELKPSHRLVSISPDEP